jgi:choline dehydrogenase-like flavoprotein
VTRTDCDVAIVGAGAAGSTLAAIISGTGRKVTVLEAGPYWRREDLISSQIFARRLKWSGPVPEPKGKHPVPHNFNSGWGVGGAALHHGGVWMRMQPDDLKTFSTYGRFFDWPISYADLQPIYDHVQEEVGLSGDHVAETWRPPGAPYPNPPLPTNSQGDLIAREFARRNLKCAPMPHAVLSREYKGRPPCIFDGWCEAGCPILALANPLAISVTQAAAAGTEFRPHAFVVRLTTSKSGNRVTSIVYRDHEGMERQLTANSIILAAYTVQNSAILLRSASSDHPGGLANSSGLVGRYFSAHTMAAVFGLFPEKTDNTYGTTGGQFFSQEGQNKSQPGKPFGSYQWQIAGAIKPNDLLGMSTTEPSARGAELSSFMQRASGHLAKMNAVCEGLPLHGNHIGLSLRRDEHGAKVPYIEHTLSPESLAMVDHVSREGLEIMQGAGATKAWAGQYSFGHLSGGTKMGEDPRLSVTNAFGRAHDIENLWVAGASLFPTNGAATPTFTVVALAHRIAADVIERS